MFLATGTPIRPLLLDSSVNLLEKMPKNFIIHDGVFTISLFIQLPEGKLKSGFWENCQ